MRKLVVCLAMLLSISLVYAQIEDYKYYRTVNTKGIREPVWINLDSGILGYLESDGKDIRIYGNSQFLPYYIEYKSGTAAIAIKSISASSEQPEFRGTSYSTSNMLDDSFSTYYQNDFSKDKNETTLVIYLENIFRLENLNMYFTDDAPLSVSVYGFINGKNELISSSSNPTVLPLNYISTNKLTVILSHKGTVKISRLSVNGETFGKILFLPVSDETRIYYAKPHDFSPNYSLDKLYTTASTKTLQVSQQFTNLLYKGETEGGIQDNCPSIANPYQTDSDRDGVGDACDNCVFTQNNDQADSDRDGVGNACDNCPFKPNLDQLDKDLDGVGWVCDDEDDDGVTNDADNCLNGYNPDQQDVDRDGIGDFCEDDDNDTILNYLDLCKNTPDPSNKDSDSDGFGDFCDNCPKISNHDQKDTDSDGFGDFCEDDDNDTVPNKLDNCPNKANSDQIDWDKDGLGDFCDNCPEVRNANQDDIDRDGVGDACDKEESRILENPVVVWSIMVVSAVVILGVAFFLKKKP